MDSLLRELRRAARALIREPAYAVAVILTLAACVGANVAVYSVVRAVLIEPLPYPEPGRLVTVYNSYPRAGAARGSNGTVDYFERRERVPAFAEVALHQGSGNTVGEQGSVERVSTMRVTPSLFRLLGVEAALGRTFTEDETVPGNHRKVVLTDAYWRERFGGEPDAVGRDLRVDGVPHAVVGVLPQDFVVVGRPDARFFLPIAFDEDDRDLDNWHSNNFGMLARLAPGATVERARAQNEALNEALIDAWTLPNARQLLEDAGYETVVAPAAEDLVRDVRPALTLLWAGVGFVLLIGCVNVANLMLARTRARVGETATRMALGASRARVAREALLEAIVLGAAGGALGVGVGALGLRFVAALGAADLPRGSEIAVDGPVLLFAAALALGASALFGLVPVARVARGDLTAVFRSEGRGRTAGHRSVLLRDGLVAAQVGLAFVLLVGAGLMLRSFRAALSVDPGFEPEGVVTGFVSLPAARYEDAGARRRFWDELVPAVRAIPGVAGAAVTTMLPFSGDNSSSILFPEGYVPPPGESILSPLQSRVGPGYFEAMGIEVLDGRTFRDGDGPDAPRVVVLDEWLARRYWPDRSPVGERVVYGAAPGQDSVPDESLFTVVGVVRTVKHNDLTAPASEHKGAYYFTYRQSPPAFVSVVVRSAAGDAASLTPAVRDALGRIDPELPLFGVRTMEERIDASLAGRKIPLALLEVFSGVALLLAGVGIYGTLAYAVAQRRREIAVRMAVGSAPEDVFRSVVARGLVLTAAGLALGGGATLLLARAVRSLLFEVRATDPVVLAGVALALGVVALAAAAVPARRATAVDPVAALGG